MADTQSPTPKCRIWGGCPVGFWCHKELSVMKKRKGRKIPSNHVFNSKNINRQKFFYRGFICEEALVFSVEMPASCQIFLIYLTFIYFVVEKYLPIYISLWRVYLCAILKSHHIQPEGGVWKMDHIDIEPSVGKDGVKMWQ